VCERERESKHSGAGGRERERENPKQVPCPTQSPTWVLIPQPWNHDLSGNQELDVQPTEPSKHLKLLRF